MHNALILVCAQLVDVKLDRVEIPRLGANVGAGIFCYSTESENGPGQSWDDFRAYDWCHGCDEFQVALDQGLNRRKLPPR